MEPYNPLDLEALGSSLLRELERRELQSLGGVPRLMGSGIYALYYVGEAEPYGTLGKFNRDHNCVVPIYVGRSRDTGSRRGVSPFEPVTKPLLWNRVKEHQRSINDTENLEVADFQVRLLVVMPIWIPLAEAMAIRRYQPLWNSELQGFGIHAPGSGRGLQRRSSWDELHPGRGFAADLKRNETATPQALLAQMREAAQRGVDAARARLQELAE